MTTSQVVNFPKPGKKNSHPISRLKIFAIIGFVIWSIDLTVLSTVEAGETSSIIDTTTGPVRGEILSTISKSLKYSSFRSIRYAEAPIGYRRFKPPVAAKRWTDVLNATVEANACPQVNLITRNYTGSEDCLFINVFTPLINFGGNDGRGKAVMVWIYGGSFISGNAKTILYGPDYLMEDDVVLVTFNYRVGPLGFLSLNHSNATGNAGMKDQLLALKWVNENIEKFGGDARRITIFGNSAGAVAVDLHTLSERSQDLFHGVISISGSLFNPWAFHTLDEAVNRSFVLGEELGADTTNVETLLKSLYEATPREIAQATFRMGETIPPFRPTIEDARVAGNDAFLTQQPLDKYRRGNFTKVPYITGYTAQETAYVFTDETVKPIASLVKSAMTTLHQINQSLPLTTSTLRNLIFTAENAIERVTNVALQELIRTTSFEQFSSGIDVKQRFLYDQSPEPVYYYQVTFNPSKSLHELLYHVIANGSAHADDLAYMFHMPIVDLPIDESDPISITRRRMVRLWTNFAKYRNPTPVGEADPLINLVWPASGSSGIHLDIGDELSVGPRPVDALDNYLQLLGHRDENVTSGASSIN